MKANLIGFVVSSLIFCAIGVGLNLLAGTATLGSAIVFSGLIVGAIVSAGGVGISLLARQSAASIASFGLGTALSSGALYFVMSLYDFNGGDLIGASAAALLGLIAGLAGAVAAKLAS